MNFLRCTNKYCFFRKVQPVYARGFTGSKPDSRINRKPFSNGKSRWVNYYNPLFHRDSCAVGVKVTRGASKVPKGLNVTPAYVKLEREVEKIEKLERIFQSSTVQLHIRPPFLIEHGEVGKFFPT